MRKLTGFLLFAAFMLWSSAAFAQYSSLEGDPRVGPWIGLGGIYISGDNNAVPSDNDNEFLPTVNIAGLSEYIAWQAFYGFGDDSNVFGATLDYIVADNFDACAAWPDGGVWWFGVGVSLMDTQDLYYDASDATAAVDDTLFGGNLGFGYAWENWALQLYGHMFQDDNMAFQGMLLYSIGN